MNRIYRLVFNHATGQMQVASELTSSHGAGSASATVGAPRRRSTLGAAVLAALAMAALPASAFAAVYDFNDDDTVTDSRAYADGFRNAPTGTAVVTLTGSGKLTSNDLVSLGTAAGSNGTLLMIGPNASLVVNQGSSMRVGDAGAGTLLLQDGAQASVAGVLSFGYQAGSTGAGSVSGATTALTARQFEVGRAGDGVLDITDGATVTATQAYSIVNNRGFTIGTSATGTGVVNVSNGGSLLVTDNNLLVGQVGKGTLNVGAGGIVNANRGVIIGAAADSNGTVLVEDGGTITTGQLTVGNAQNSTGLLTVTGAGSAIDATNVWVGSSGSGTLRIEEGGVVKAVDVIAERYDGIGSGNLGQTGRIEIDGQGSAIEADRVQATNELLVTNGGQIRSSTARVKDSYADGDAIATLTGTGSSWTNTGVMEVFGNLDVLDGATVSTDTLSVSGGANSATLVARLEHEQVRVSGAGSTLTATNGITVGRTIFEPYGILSVSNGGRIDAGTSLTIGTTGYVAIGGGMEEWSRADGEPLWRAAEAAGELSASPILMDTGAGGLVFNHTGDITLTNDIAAITPASTSGALHQLAGTTTLDGDLSGFGGDVKVRGGTLVINSSMYDGTGYAGGTQAPQQQISVSNGTLVLNGEAGFQQEISYGTGLGSAVIRASTAVISNGGTLAGNATVGRTFVRNGSVLSPGNSGVGKMVIDGDLYFNNVGVTAEDVANKAFYDVDVLGNGQADLLTVTGKAYLGQVAIAGEHGETGVRVTALDAATSYQTGQTYTILSAAGGIEGTFTDVVSQSAFLDSSLSYAGNDVLLTIAVKDTGGTDPGNPGNPDPGTPVDPGTPGVPGTPEEPGNGGLPPALFVTAAVTGNQLATAAALDSLQQSGDALALYNQLLVMDAGSARLAFDQLSGEVHAANRSLLLEDRFLRDSVSQRLRSNPSVKANGGGFWLSGGGASNRQDGDDSAARARQHREGLAAGLDWTFGDAWTVGFAAGTEQLRTQLDTRSAKSDVDAVHGGLYASFRAGQAWFTGGASYADYDVDTQRNVALGTASQTLNGSYNAHAVSAFAEGGWDLALDRLTLTPYLAVAYTRLSSEAAQEAGGTAALAIEASKDEVWTTTAGVRATWDISAGQDDGAQLVAGLAWQNAAGELRADSRQRFVAGSSSFSVDGAPLARNVGIAELGVSVNTSDNSRLALSAQGRAGGGQHELGAQMTWNLQF